MAPKKRYAEGTPVEAVKSRGEVMGLLGKYGCERMAVATMPEGDTIEFELGGRHFRFFVERPTPESVRARDAGDYAYPHNVDWRAKSEAEWRRRWRAHVLLLKAKLEFVDGGETTLEREFMPYLVAGNGQTLGDLIETGALPLLAAGGAK